MNPYNVGILGATGMVGQRLVQRVAHHPWFHLVALCASDRSVGKPYAEAVRWRLSEDPPARASSMAVRPSRVDELGECDLVLSGLDADVARGLEVECAEAGLAVVSNSSAHRQGPDVPLVVPEVNADHLRLLDAQRRRSGSGFIVTNPNCSVTGLVLALAPLHSAFGVRRAVVATLQAVSGAGLEGPRALDLLDNVIPHIAGEEEKIEREVGKILGDVGVDGAVPAPMAISAHCHRVGTLDGHLQAVSIELEREGSPERAAEALRSFTGQVGELSLPSAPSRPVLVRTEPDRPQPRLDRDAGGGMSVVVGRIRRCPVLSLRLVLLSHNTVRGAAGGTLLNAELLAARGLLPRRATR
jgi:aspartate-semialdehyde dehydrogenase